MEELLFNLQPLCDREAAGEILQINQETAEQGLRLTKSDALELVETRAAALKGLGRVEIGGGTVEKIIRAFSTSPYLWQGNYAQTLHELLETFYYIKNETLDEVPDDELIQWMRDDFDNRCRGSIELLQGRELEQLARNVRYGVEDYGKTDPDEGEETTEEEDDETF